MASPHPIEFDFKFLHMTTNVSFSWKAKSGVPKLQLRSSPSISLFERSVLKLPSPPCRSKSATLPSDYSAAVPYSPMHYEAKSAKIAKDNLWLEAYYEDFALTFDFECCKCDGLKERDPFVEAYKKCTNGPWMSCRPISGGSATNGVKTS